MVFTFVIVECVLWNVHCKFEVGRLRNRCCYFDDLWRTLNRLVLLSYVFSYFLRNCGEHHTLFVAKTSTNLCESCIRRDTIKDKNNSFNIMLYTSTILSYVWQTCGRSLLKNKYAYFLYFSFSLVKVWPAFEPDK